MRTLRCARWALGAAMTALLLTPPVARGAEPPGQRWGLPESSAIYELGQRGRQPFYHDVGLLKLMITNIGVIGNPNFTDGFAAEWQGGEYLYAAALWVGAIANDNLPYVSTGAYEFEFRPSLEPEDTIYRAYEGIANGNRLGFSTSPDDDNDGQIDEDFHNGKDDDNDGRIDEDYAAISQQMFSCEYWDYTQEAVNGYPEHRPLYLRVQQNSFQWSTQRANEFVGFDFKIFNDGYEVLRRLYIGFFVDSDVGRKDAAGYYTDDKGNFYNSDTLVVDQTNTFKCTQHVTREEKDCSKEQMHLSICYMWDEAQGGSNAIEDDVKGFFGGMFLGHTIDPFGVSAPAQVTIHTAQFFSGSGSYPAGDPRNDFERYDLLSKGSKINRPTGQPSDYRYLFSAGPFKELAPGEHLTFQTAFVIGEGQSGMLQNAISAQKIYNGAWRDVDDNKITGQYKGDGGNETCLFKLPDQPALSWKDPCDSLNPTVRTIRETVCLPDNYVDNDCDCCTPLYRSELEARTNGNETLIHWVGDVAPPPPGSNIDEQGQPTLQVSIPGNDRKVQLEWDNLSELAASPTQRRILFTGYRVWRVEGWNRPIGSTGPNPDEWQLIADLSLNPPDSLGNASAFYLPKYRRYPPVGPDSINRAVQTGSEIPEEMIRYYYPAGHYVYTDTLGLKNGMLYFYDVTAYSAWDQVDATGKLQHIELAGRPSAAESDAVVPRWKATTEGEDVIVVPNPYIRGGQPSGWDLTPSDADPTGTKIAFANLPKANCTVRIYTLSGDLVQTLTNDGRSGSGTVFWPLISRNGQDVVSGVYLYTVECKDCVSGAKGCGDRKIGRFTIVR
jgi:hypothetical protein